MIPSARHLASAAARAANTATYTRLNNALTLICADGAGAGPPRGGRPLAVLIPWLGAAPTHVSKFAALYAARGFDVLTVRVAPWRVLAPSVGIQALAGDVMEFLRENGRYEQLVVHGFSIGGFLWGEICIRTVEQNLEYQPVMNRFVGQVWDSVAFLPALPLGVSTAVFPTNAVLQKALQAYIKFHQGTFHGLATRFFVRSDRMFHANLLTAPALFLVSNADPVGSSAINRRVHDSWASRGVQTHWKCWDDSAHVGHYRKYPEEYEAEIDAFLDRLKLVPSPEENRAKI